MYLWTLHTSLSFNLRHGGTAELMIYDLGGHHIRTLVDETLTVGQHTVTWDGRDANGLPAASGVYLARLRALGL